MNERFKETTDHDEIRRWAEELGGKPQLWDDPEVTADRTGIRIDFPGAVDDQAIPLDHRPHDIGWDEFFRFFDDRKLIFEYRADNPAIADKALLYRFKPRWDT